MHLRFLFMFPCLLTLASCNNHADPSSPKDSARLQELAVDSNASIEELRDKAQLYVWQVDANAKTKTLNPNLREEYIHVDSLISGLNHLFPRVTMEKLRLSHDTLYSVIRNSEHLTERMGSSGSELYIAHAVINLTTVPGVRFVNIHFKEGSHASPGVWSKESFKDYEEAQ